MLPPAFRPLATALSPNQTGMLRLKAACRAPQDRDSEIARLREQLEEFKVAPPALVPAGAGPAGEDGTVALLERPAAAGGWSGSRLPARELRSHPILCALGRLVLCICCVKAQEPDVPDRWARGVSLHPCGVSYARSAWYVHGMRRKD